MEAPQDPRFSVVPIRATQQPQILVYLALHTDYSAQFVAEEGSEDLPSESQAGRIIVDRLLAGKRGHYGPLEHPSITFACGYFPHSVVQQARTHRVGISFDVQSGRYTSGHVLRAAAGELDIEDVFYLRPAGVYTARNGDRYHYSHSDRANDREAIAFSIQRYRAALAAGMAEEHSRGLLPFDIRQHFVVSFNLRSLMHFLDLRHKADAQLEIQQLCSMMLPAFEAWAPEVAEWYRSVRLGRALLAP